MWAFYYSVCFFFAEKRHAEKNREREKRACVGNCALCVRERDERREKKPRGGEQTDAISVCIYAQRYHAVKVICYQTNEKSHYIHISKIAVVVHFSSVRVYVIKLDK